MYSKWNDASNRSMDEILISIFNKEGKSYTDPLTNTKLEYDITPYSDDNLELVVNNSKFQYRALEYYYEQPRKGYETQIMKNDRIVSHSGMIIIYSDGIVTQYIINKSTPQAKTTLRFLTESRDSNKTVNHVKYEIESDSFFWLINRVRQSNRVIDTDKNFEVSRILGYAGSGEEKEATISGSGNGVINLVSTLTFLLESPNLKMIKVRVTMDSNVYEIMLNTNGMVDVDVNQYTGDHILEMAKDRDPKIILESMLSIIPALLDGYENDVSADFWNSTIRKEFSTNLVTTITEKVAVLI
ncbi:Putative uncharacterized protein [Leuconostoc citreum LBAE E16]|nr:Putative uncharacterized protein [Leuconostoc citreum LBAE E16]